MSKTVGDIIILRQVCILTDKSTTLDAV